MTNPTLIQIRHANIRGTILTVNTISFGGSFTVIFSAYETAYESTGLSIEHTRVFYDERHAIQYFEQTIHNSTIVRRYRILEQYIGKSQNELIELSGTELNDDQYRVLDHLLENDPLIQYTDYEQYLGFNHHLSAYSIGHFPN